jgi:hypothetical protein
VVKFFEIIVSYNDTERKVVKLMGNNVIHPGHYNIPGRKECWDEMVERFGVEATKTFCKLNYFKYQYRHSEKNGQEDLKKAENYHRKFIELGGTEEEFKEGM